MSPLEFSSTRFCLTCNDKRTFRYDPVCHHSLCEVCGKHFALRFPTVEWYEQKISDLESALKKQSEINYKIRSSAR